MKILMANSAVSEEISPTKERYYIKAGSRWPWSYEKNKKDICRPPFPFYLAYAAKVLLNEGFDVHALDGVALNISREEFIKRTVALDPDVIVVETAMHAFLHDVNLAKELKRLIPKIKLVFVGPHATSYAEKILEDYPFIDFVIKGEYDFALCEVVKLLSQGAEEFPLDGVGYKKNGDAVLSEKRGYIEDVNTLPFPAFEIFPSNEEPDISRYGDGVITYNPSVTLHSSRGCPYGCDFCLWPQVMYGNRVYRMFDPKRVVDEMEYVINKFGAKEVYFDDDDFCVNKKHVVGICNEIKARGINIPWSCMGDAMSSDEEMIKAMADAGCIFMKFGVENGNKEVLKKIGKPLDPVKAIQVSRWCRKYGIMTHATFMFGTTGDTLDTMQETLSLANKIKFDYAQASIATPFPGTAMHNKLVQAGILKEVEYNKFDGARTRAFDTEDLSTDQVVRFRKKAIRSMVLHKAMDLGWWRNYIRRNRILRREYGMSVVLDPFKALLRL